MGVCFPRFRTKDGGRSRCPAVHYNQEEEACNPYPRSLHPLSSTSRYVTARTSGTTFCSVGCDESVRDLGGTSRFKSTRQRATLDDQVGFYTPHSRRQDVLVAPPPDPQFTITAKEVDDVSPEVSEGSVPDLLPTGWHYEVRGP